jgi:uncharacterized protein YeaC (DUF1315 family)
MPVLVPDTNMLVKSPRLSSPAWKSLSSNAASWDLRILIPDVVFMETVNVVRRDWLTVKGKVEDLKVGVFGLNSNLESMAQVIQQQIDDYEEFLRKRIEEIGASIVSLPSIQHFEIATRSSLGRAPYAKDKDGYRDTLIWLTLLDVAEQHSAEDVWFVSENLKDFGPKTGDWTRDDCPLQFHSHLCEDLEERGLKGRVHYVISMERVEQHLAAQHAPITDDTLHALTEQLDYALLGDYLAVQTAGIPVEPSQAALSPTAVRAAVNHVRTDEAKWSFNGAARRGEGSWTARFSVVVDVDMEVAYPESIRIETKPLRLTGDITIAEPSTIRSLTITSLGALRDDPQRALWEPVSHEVLDSMTRLAGLKVFTSETQERLARIVNPITPAMYEQMARIVNPITPEVYERLAGVVNPIASEMYEQMARIVNPITPEVYERLAGVVNPTASEMYEQMARVVNPITPEMYERMRQIAQISGHLEPRPNGHTEPQSSEEDDLEDGPGGEPNPEE